MLGAAGGARVRGRLRGGDVSRGSDGDLDRLLGISKVVVCRFDSAIVLDSWYEEGWVMTVTTSRPIAGIFRLSSRFPWLNLFSG